MGRFANFAAFQATWFAAVIGAGRGHAGWGVAAVALFAALQLRMQRTRRADLRLLAVAGMAGFALDSALVATGLLRYAAPWPLAGLAPAWIVALWMGLALTLNHSLRWLRSRPWLAGALGALAAPLSYLGAARGWQAVAFAPPVAGTLAIVAACWAVMLWALVSLARRWARAPAPAWLQPA